MTIEVYHITGDAWTPITAAGESGTCWLQELPVNSQVVINHSDTLTEFNISESYFLLNAKRRIQPISADSSGDIYYARCSLPGKSAVVLADTGAGFIGGDPQTQSNTPIPSSFSTQSSVSNSFIIQKGQLNQYRIRQAILNEHNEEDSVIQGVVNNTTIVGQTFRASHDNINGVMLTLESAAGILFDDFESYETDAELQAVWVANSARLATLEEVIVQQGDQSMRMPATNNNDEWVITIPVTDYTNYTADFQWQQTDLNNKLEVSIFIGDGTNTKSFPLIVPVKDEWIQYQINEISFTEDGGGTTDITAITQVGFRITDPDNGAVCYLDNAFSIPQPGSVGLKLFHNGSNQPVSGVDSLDDMTQYTQIGDLGIGAGTVVSEVVLDLLGGKKEYFLENFVAGAALEIPGNELLIPGDYYVITVNYINTNVSVYGTNPTYGTNYYQSGYAFITPNEATAIAQIGTYNDLHFGVFSTQDAFLNFVARDYTLVDGSLSSPGRGSTESMRIVDKDFKIIGVIAQQTKPREVFTPEFKTRVYPLPKGCKVEVDHNDQVDDEIFFCDLLIGYIHEPSEPYL